MTKLRYIQEKLTNLKPILKSKFKVKKIGVFGSYAKNQQRPNSDVDILVEFSETIGLFKFIELENYLKKEIKLDVDLVVKNGLKNRIKQTVIRDTIYV